MRRKSAPALAPSEITPYEVFADRRRALAALGLAGAAVGLGRAGSLLAADAAPGASAAAATRFKAARNNALSIADAPNSWEEITGYNNYYEFGTDKDEPAKNAGTLKTNPWNVTVDGEAEVKGTFTLEDFLKPHTFEERVYRLRCVEAWSMVIPWVGVPMGDLLKRFKPTSKAKYVEFTTLLDPKQMPGQRARILDWPYVEGLRIDEAMHPLTLMAVGVYGKPLPNQNGAPLRVVTPWKYGFKNGKSIVKIRFTEQQPRNTWMVSNPREYGFYANVNPAVDHPRWSQASERIIGTGFIAKRRQTQPFNGYADQVASLYSGMDLRKFY